MKRARKILLTILPVMMFSLVLFLSFGSSVLGVHSGGGGSKEEGTHEGSPEPIIDLDIKTGFPESTGQIAEIDNMANKIWGTVLSIVQILAFAAIVIAGVRYMFASAEQKSDIKTGLIYLVLGAILVFASSTTIKIIVNATKEVTTTSEVLVVREIENA